MITNLIDILFLIVFKDCKESFRYDEQPFIEKQENNLEHQFLSRIFGNQKYLAKIRSMYTEHMPDVDQIHLP